VRSAVAAGLRCVGVAHAYPAGDLAAAGAHFVAASIAAIGDAELEA
jgi:hypothetical protein